MLMPDPGRIGVQRCLADLIPELLQVSLLRVKQLAAAIDRIIGDPHPFEPETEPSIKDGLLCL